MRLHVQNSNYFVNGLLKASGRHDGEVDCAAEIDEVGVGHVLDAHLLLGLIATSFGGSLSQKGYQKHP